MTADSPHVPVATLQAFCEDALRRCGVSAENAATAADVLVTTDAMGVFTHGTKSLRGYVKRLRGGGLKADAAPRIVAEGPAWAIVDGGSCLGMIGAVHAMNAAIRKAKSAGVAYVGLRNNCHFGAAGYYAHLAAQHGLIGIAMANDTPSMAVPSSRGAVLGTNPFAYAVPAGAERPIVLDIASSAVAGGKVRIVQSLGERAPEGWLVDAEGVPTTDPWAYPFNGSLLPFGGHKGYGIALLIETLSAVLTGAGVRWEVGSWIDSDPAQPTHHGAAFLAIDIAAMMPLDVFKARVDTTIRDIHEAPRARGAERIVVPGEIEWEKRDQSLATGIPLPADVVESLRGLAGDLGMAAEWLDGPR